MSHSSRIANPLQNCSILFFDLDGTLTDPREGITRCLQYGLQCLGRPFPPQEELIQYIGPSLRWTFPRLLGSDDEKLIEAAVRHYRCRYVDTGIFENEVYDGIPKLLNQLHAQGFALYVVTSKPTVYAERIVRHFQLDRFFTGVFGPELDGRFDDKAELIAHLLGELNVQAAATIMIGDRASDIMAGKANGTRTIAVTYGFGTLEELLAVEPDGVCHSPDQISSMLNDVSRRTG